MPVQVFPSGPPPPPPTPSKSQLNATNASNANRSPSLPRKTNQSFEPPPLGLRPEIKIPPNPMAQLRKVPQPKEKNDYWIEEYKKERSKSPMPGQDEVGATAAPQYATSNGTDGQTQSPQSQHDYNNYSVTKPSVDKVDSPVPSFHQQNNETKNESPKALDQNNNYAFNYPANNYAANNNNNSMNNNFMVNNVNRNSNPNSPQQRINSPFTSSPQPVNLPKPLSPVKLAPQETENFPIYTRSSQRASSEKPQAPQPPVSNLTRQSSLEQAQPPIYTRSQRNNVTAAQPNQNNQQQQQQQTENVPIYVRSFQKQQAPQPPRPAAQDAPKPLSTAQSTFNSDPGRQYYQQQPNRVMSPPENESQQNPLANQQMPPWMTRRANQKDVPEWASNVDNYAANNRTAMPHNNSFQQSNGQNTNNNSYPMNGNNDYTNGAGMKVMFWFFFYFSFINLKKKKCLESGTHCSNSIRSIANKECNITHIHCSAVSKYTITI